MNAARRKSLAEVTDLLQQAKDLLETVMSDERDAFDNMPDSLRESDRGQEMEAGLDAMDEAVNEIDSAMDQISDNY